MEMKSFLIILISLVFIIIYLYLMRNNYISEFIKTLLISFFSIIYGLMLIIIAYYSNLFLPSIIDYYELQQVQIVSASGEHLGSGTLQMFHNDSVNYPDTTVVRLVIDIPFQVTQRTPFATPPTLATATPNPNIPTPTPPVPRRNSSIEVYQLMGASLFCSAENFDGCDNAASPEDARVINPLGFTRWSWILTPRQAINSTQHLNLEIWTINEINGEREQAQTVYSYPFTLQVITPFSLENWMRENPVIVVAILTPIVGVIGYFGKRFFENRQNKPKPNNKKTRRK